MTKQRKTKIERAIILIERGATTAAIVKALNVSPQYVYNVRSKMNKRNKEAETIIPAPVQLELKIEPAPIVQQTATVEQATQHLNSIQGEYSKHQEMSTWQRFKAAIGF
jgi:orotate phosphoribosyltransferase-like protein